jgi:integral membrane sensor domain MASE1
LYYSSENQFGIYIFTFTGISSVCLPSAITLALVIKQGVRVCPGIILSSIFGVSASLLTYTPPLSLFNFIFLNIIYAAANCLQPLLVKYTLQKFDDHKNIFNHIHITFIFIIAIIISSFISATMGITAHLLTGVIKWNIYATCWIA